MKKWLAAFLQIGLTLALGWNLLSRISLGATWEQASKLSPIIAVGVVLLGSSQFVIVGLRLKLVVKALGHDRSVWACLRSNFAGAFVGQTPLTTFGNDVVRVWCLAGQKLLLRDAASAVAIDRVMGMIALLLWVLVSAVPLWQRLSDAWMRLGLLVGILGALGGIVILVLLRFLPVWIHRFRVFHWATEMATELGRMLTDARDSTGVLGLGMLVHFTSISMIYWLARSLGAPLSPLQCLTLVPFPLFLSSLPISISGWGVREGALVIAFGLVGVPPQTTLAVSVLFGLILLMTSLPGGIVLLDRRLLPYGNPASHSPSNHL